MNMPDDELQRAKMQKLQDERMKYHARDEIRNLEELLESRRREKVLTGEWPEAESHLLLQQEQDEKQARFPTRSSFDIFMREKRKQDLRMLELRNSS